MVETVALTPFEYALQRFHQIIGMSAEMGKSRPILHLLAQDRSVDLCNVLWALGEYMPKNQFPLFVRVIGGFAIERVINQLALTGVRQMYAFLEITEMEFVQYEGNGLHRIQIRSEDASVPHGECKIWVEPPLFRCGLVLVSHIISEHFREEID